MVDCAPRALKPEGPPTQVLFPPLPGAPSMQVTIEDVQVQVGDTAQFDAVIEGNPPPTVTWYKVGAGPGSRGRRQASGAGGHGCMYTWDHVGVWGSCTPPSNLQPPLHGPTLQSYPVPSHPTFGLHLGLDIQQVLEALLQEGRVGPGASISQDRLMVAQAASCVSRTAASW